MAENKKEKTLPEQIKEQLDKYPKKDLVQEIYRLRLCLVNRNAKVLRFQKHLQEFKEELKEELFTTSLKLKQMSIIDTQMQKHFGKEII